MRSLLSRSLVLAAFFAVPQVATAQLFGTSTFFGYGAGFKNFYFGGGFAHPLATYYDNLPHTGQWSNSANITTQSGNAAGQAQFGFLQASAYAFSTDGVPPGGTSYWFMSSATTRTDTEWWDRLYVQTSGVLTFSFAMSNALTVGPSQNSTDPYCNNVIEGANCAFARSEIGIFAGNAVAIDQTTTGTSGTNIFQLAVNAGNILDVYGILTARGSTCEGQGWGGPYCIVPSQGGEWADAQASANYYIDGSAGATYTSASGNDYTQTTSTPEPGSIILLATGLVGVAAAARRRKQLIAPSPLV